MASCSMISVTGSREAAGVGDSKGAAVGVEMEFSFPGASGAAPDMGADHMDDSEEDDGHSQVAGGSSSWEADEEKTAKLDGRLVDAINGSDNVDFAQWESEKGEEGTVAGGQEVRKNRRRGKGSERRPSKRDEAPADDEAAKEHSEEESDDGRHGDGASRDGYVPQWLKDFPEYEEEWTTLDESARPSAANASPDVVKRCGRGIRRLYVEMVPTRADFTMRKHRKDEVERLFGKVKFLRESNVAMFGSWVTTLGTRESDLDLCLVMLDPPEETGERERLIFRLASVLGTNGYEEIRPIPRASVPIVKFRHTNSWAEMDLCVNFEPRFTLGVYCSRLLRAYAKFDSVVRPLALVIKHWSKRRSLNNAHQGLLSSHGLVLMLLHWLQQDCCSKGPVLPDLQSIGRTTSKIVAGCDVRFCNSTELAREIFGKPEVGDPIRLQNSLLMPRDDDVLFELLAGFFHYYAQVFDVRRDVVRLTPSRGGTLQCHTCERTLNASWFPKRDGGVLNVCKDCGQLGKKHQRPYRPLAIEDPIDVTRDVMAVLNRGGQQAAFREFDRAWRLLVSSGDVNQLCAEVAQGSQW
eukprot:EG_transcript_4157